MSELLLTIRSYVWPYCRSAWRLQPDLERRRNGVTLNAMTEDTSVAAYHANTVLWARREIVAGPHGHDEIATLGTQAIWGR